MRKAKRGRRESMGFCAVCNERDHLQEAHERIEPVRITLEFQNPADREHFLAQFFDGWGENLVDVCAHASESGVYAVKPLALFPEEVNA